MIKIRDLNKFYDGFHVLSDLNMTVPRGSIYGLIGINGAGKTTILQLLSGVLKQDSGLITFNDEEVWENRSLKERIGFIPDELYFPNGYNLEKVSKLYAGLYPNWDENKFQQLTTSFHLDTKSKIQKFSKGMKRKAAFCLTLPTMPDFLLLDESMDGLDPLMRRLAWKHIIEDVADRNMTVVISSHNIKEMEGICDHIGILSGNCMKFEKEMNSLKGDLYKIQISFGDNPEDTTYSKLNVLHKESRGSVDLLLVKDSKEKIESYISEYNPLICDILPLTLEEVFIYELGGNDDEIKKLIF